MTSNLQNKGDNEAALPILREIVLSRERAQGADHPDLARALNNLALLLWQLGRHEDAIPFQERAWQIKQKRGDDDEKEYLDELEGLRARAPYPYGEDSEKDFSGR